MFTVSQGIKIINKKTKELLRKQKVVIIGIAGGSGSGKTYIAKKIYGKWLGLDSYYRGLKKLKVKNFDLPSAVELKLLRRHMEMLHKGKAIRKPVYSFVKQARAGFENYKPAKVIIVEGLFALHGIIMPEVDVKVFVHSPLKKRLARRIRRDVAERGRTRASVIKQFLGQAEPAYRKYVLPTEKYADVVIKN